jgi:hypothetical protein
MWTRVCLSLVLVAAGACARSLDPAAKSDIDRRVAALKVGGELHGTPGSAEPMPFAVGQWATYRFLDKDRQPSFLTLKIVGEEGGAYWYETVSESYQGTTVARMLVEFGDRKNPDSISIKAAKMKDHKGQVTEFPEGLIGLMNSTLRGNLGPIVMNWEGLPQENVEVPAGRFVGAFKGRTAVSFAGFNSSSVVWGHTAVPLSGMVRSQSDDGTVGDLVAFGTTGAASTF